MRKKIILGMVAALVLGMVGSAQATIVSGTPDVSFKKGHYTLDLADGAASYSFKKGPAVRNGFNAKVKTGGSALVAALYGTSRPAAYATDASSAPFVDGNLFAVYFRAFNSYKTIRKSSTDTYLALAFNLDDGIHYGYARIDGTQFLSFGYETVAGMGIQAGSMAATPVPEPGSLAMLAFGLALVGAGTAAARRRKI